AKTRGILRQRAVVIVTCGDVKQSFTWMRPDTSPAVSACTAPGIAGSLVWDVRDDVSAIADRRVVDIHPKTHHSVAWRRAETGQHVDVHEPVCRELGIDRYSKHSGLPLTEEVARDNRRAAATEQASRRAVHITH